MNTTDFYNKYRYNSKALTYNTIGYDIDYKDSIISYLDAFIKLSKTAGALHDEIGNVYHNEATDEYYVVITIGSMVELMNIIYNSDGVLDCDFQHCIINLNLEEFEEMKKNNEYTFVDNYYAFSGIKSFRISLGSNNEIRKLNVRIKELEQKISNIEKGE